MSLILISSNTGIASRIFTHLKRVNILSILMMILCFFCFTYEIQEDILVAFMRVCMYNNGIVQYVRSLKTDGRNKYNQQEPQ